MNGLQFAAQRVVQGTQAVLRAWFVDQDGEVRTPSAVTVQVKRADGSIVLAAGTATTADGEAVTVSLTPAQTTQLDILTCTWTETSTGSKTTTIVDICGGRYFSIYDARHVDPELRRTERFPDEDIKRVRDEVEAEVERITGRSFVPRFRFDEAPAARGPFRLSNVDVRAVRYLKVGGVAYASSYWELTNGSHIQLTADIGLFSHQIANGPNAGSLPTLLNAGYEFGWPAPPHDLKRAMLQRLRSRLLTGQTQIPDRATSMTIDGGTFSLSTPGMRGAKTGIPDVDEIYGDYVRANWKEDFVGSMRIV